MSIPLYLTIRQYSGEWEKKTGYEVSPRMQQAVQDVIKAADPFGASIDDPKYVRMMTDRILNAALLP